MKIEDINTILLYTFVILLLFCIMYILFYSEQDISFGDNLDILENKHTIVLKDKIDKINKISKKEKFDSVNIDKIEYNIDNKSFSIDNNVYVVKNPVEALRTRSSNLTINQELGVTTPVAPTVADLYNSQNSMLDTPQGWTAATNNITGDEYIILDLGTVFNVAGVVTQGRGPGLSGATIKLQSVKEYTVFYSSDGTTWTSVDNGFTFSGNIESNYFQRIQNKKIGNLFQTPVLARYIKVIPKAFIDRISMRVGILTLLKPYYSENEGKIYLQSLSDFNYYLSSNQDNLVKILATINNAKEASQSNNQVLMDSITNLYYKAYLQHINKVNAEVTNKYNKMLKPKVQVSNI